MKFLFITDTHFTAKAPASRIDDFQKTIKNKLIEVGKIIKKEKIDILLHGGDMFHSPDVSNKFCGEIAEIFKSYNIPIYVNIGNHDVYGYNISTIDNTKLGLFAKAGIVNLINREKPLVFNEEGYKIGIEAQEYYADIDKDSKKDYMFYENDVDYKILLIHSMLLDHEFFKEIPHTQIKNVNTEADLVLAGHYHPGFKTKEINGTTFINPGSLLRVDSSIGSFEYTPSVVKLDVTRDKMEYEFIALKSAKPAEKIFKEKKATESGYVNIEALRKKIKESSLEKTSIFSLLEDVEKIHPEDKTLIEEIRDRMNKAEIEKSVDGGFIESFEPVTIEKVEIHNFQAHEKKTVTFEDGLNILVGSSNSGKTAIIRAIQWVLYDSPSGNAFITTGKKKTKVILTLSNGYIVERNRTKTSSGSYKLTDPEGETLEFKGFSNNIPIEIINAHQVPEIKVGDSKIRINIQSQLEGAFMLSSTQSERINLLGSLVGAEKADAANKEISLERRRNSSSKKQLEELLFEEKEKLDKFKDLEKAEQTVQLIEKSMILLNSLEEKVKKLRLINEEFNRKKEKLKEVSLELFNLSNVDIDIFNKYKESIERIEKLIIVQKNYNIEISKKKVFSEELKSVPDTSETSSLLLSLENSINSFNELSNIKSEYDLLKKQKFDFNFDLESLSDDTSKLNTLVSKLENILGVKNKIDALYEKYDKAKNAIDENNSKINELDNSKNELIESLKKELEGQICPTCGQEILNIESVVE